MYYLNHKDTQSLVKAINKSRIKLKILEIGAGIGISSAIFEEPGASKTLIKVESFYSKEVQERYIKGFNRSVSKEFIDSALQYLRSDLLDENTTMASSFQLPQEEGYTNHGWIGLTYQNTTRFYHITLPSIDNRKELIKLYGETGLKILWSRNQMPLLEGHCVDAVYDNKGKPLFNETIQAISSSYNSGALFYTVPGGIKIERVEETLRDFDKVILFKGSFNPVHEGHRAMMKQSIGSFGNKSLTSSNYVLSFNNRDKGEVTAQEMSCRLFNLLEDLNLHTKVILIKNPSFKDLINFIGDKAKKDSLVFPMGTDTFIRLREDHDLDIFENNEGIVFNREDNFTLSSCVYPKVTYVDFNMDHSSTDLRN